MKPEELMIGDWVFNTHHEKNVQITPYDFFTHGHYPDGTQYITVSHSIVSGQDFEPIPITSEILEKNGFFEVVDNCKYATYHLKNIKTNIVMFPTPELTIFTDKKILIHGLPIHYVHELQHALRLCKIDKEIVL